MAFLVFEGLDGAGKSTLIERLAQDLKGRGFSLTLTREPGGTPFAEEIRALLLKKGAEHPVPRAELLLYEAARAQHVDRVIAPALQRGDWVLCDRFTASTVAFQAVARGLDRRAVDWLNAYAIDATKPDLFVLLDLTVNESFRRYRIRNHVSKQEADRFESEASEFHEAVRRGYLEQAKAEPSQWLVLDATQTPDELFNRLLLALDQRGFLKRAMKSP